MQSLDTLLILRYASYQLRQPLPVLLINEPVEVYMHWTLSRIRYATLNDARSISTIYQQSTQSAYQDFMSEAPIYSRLLDRLETFWVQKLAIPPKKEQRLLVAEYKGKGLGSVGIGAATYPE